MSSRASPGETEEIDYESSVRGASQRSEQEGDAFQYDPSDFVPTPKEIGIRRGGKLGDVFNAARGMAYYGDMIVFGRSSGKFSENNAHRMKILGVNHFMPTDLTCHNGTQMYLYNEYVPKGDALGKRVQAAVASTGLPPLKGLAPGVVEDIKNVANVRPLVNTMFGSIYPVCEKKTLPVGTAEGQIVQGGKSIITGAKDVQWINGVPHQTRWIQATKPNGDPVTLSKEEFDKIPKAFNFDGSPAASTAAATAIKEKFSDMNLSTIDLSVLGVATATILVAIGLRLA